MSHFQSSVSRAIAKTSHELLIHDFGSDDGIISMTEQCRGKRKLISELTWYACQLRIATRKKCMYSNNNHSTWYKSQPKWASNIQRMWLNTHQKFTVKSAKCTHTEIKWKTVTLQLMGKSSVLYFCCSNNVAIVIHCDSVFWFAFCSKHWRKKGGCHNAPMIRL